MSDDQATYGLIVAFPDGSASFVNGFEAGKLWQLMTSGAVAEIDLVIHTDNVEVVTRMALAEGWHLVTKPTDYEEWTSIEMAKVKTPTTPNPHGFRVVKP